MCVLMTCFTSYYLCDRLVDPWIVRIYVCMRHEMGERKIYERRSDLPEVDVFTVVNITVVKSFLDRIM